VFAAHAINKRNIDIKLLIILVISATCFYPMVGADRFAPFIAFLSIFAGYLIGITKKKFLLLTVLLVFVGFFSYHTKNKLDQYNNVPKSVENPRVLKIVKFLKDNDLDDKEFYILSNDIEVYYLLDKPTNLYNPLLFPVISSYYKNYQEIYINEIKKNKTEIVIIPLPLDPNYASSTKLISFINAHFISYHEEKDFIVYTKRPGQH
jgi:hypothetical protein